MEPVFDDRKAWRNVPWGGAGGGEEFVFLGENLAGADYQLQIRTAPGNRTGAALVDLATTANPAIDGLTWAWDAGYLDPQTGAVVGATIITPLILDTTLEGLPWPTERDKPIELAYDFLVTRVGGIQRIEACGKFILYPGVTV